MTTPFDWYEFRFDPATEDERAEARARLEQLSGESRSLEPIRTPRGLDSVISALPTTLSHSERVALLDAPQFDLDGMTPMEWLMDDGAAAIVIAALTQHGGDLPVSHLVETLTHALGRKLVAYIASARDTSTVRGWEHGDAAPDFDVVVRLSATFHAVDVLRTSVSDSEIRAWMQGKNDVINDVAPARLLREGTDPAGVAVLAAARQHVARRH